jgi:hypothetical protein
MTGTCIGFERGDYLHALIRTADGKSHSFFVTKPGLDYFLAAHKGQPLSITYLVVDTYIPEAGAVTTIERISVARAGAVTDEAWWKQARKAASAEELSRKYDKIIDPPAPAPFYLGNWRVVGYKFMPISAMSNDKARIWLDRRAVYNATTAQFFTEKCPDATYVTKKVSADDFVRDYRLKPSDLGIAAGPVEIIEVKCAGHPFAAPGGILIKRADGRMLTLWDGVFFILQKRQGADSHNERP